MKRGLLLITMGIALSFLVQQAGAVDLLGIYQQALHNDPTFKAAFATQMEAAEQTPAAFSALLPQLSLLETNQLSRSTTESNMPGQSRNTTRSRSMGYSLSLTQEIFNWSNWEKLASAKYAVKAAKATYNAAALSLMNRTITAYFNVLNAQDKLRYIKEKKQADYQEYVRAKERLKVGLATITDVYNAKAAYDGSVADYIQSQNNLANQWEDLSVITGHHNKYLAPLKTRVAFPSPTPTNIEQWVSTAVSQNWDLKAARYTTLAAQRAMRSAKAGHLPTLNFSAKYGNNYTRTFREGRTRVSGPSAELDLAVPLYSGGSVSSAARKAAAAYEFSSQTQLNTYRSTLAGTRKAYLAVLTSLSQIRASKQAVVSYKSALEGTKAGYNVGTETMVDVLNAQQSLFQAQQNYANSRYAYIINSAGLKSSAGILKPADLQQINQWLATTSSISRPAPARRTHKRVNTKPAKQRPPFRSTPPTQHKQLYLQAGAYYRLADANALLPTLKQLTPTPCQVYMVKIHNKTIYRVQIGPIVNRQQARKIALNIQSANLPKPIMIYRK